MRYDEKYWTDRMADDAPENVQRAIKRIYNTYPPECLPQGLCDPMYIMNVICYELGVGDGQGHFNSYDSLVAENARLREALTFVAKFYQDNFDIMPVAFQTVDDFARTALGEEE